MNYAHGILVIGPEDYITWASSKGVFIENNLRYTAHVAYNRASTILIRHEDLDGHLLVRLAGKGIPAIHLPLVNNPDHAQTNDHS